MSSHWTLTQACRMRDPRFWVCLANTSDMATPQCFRLGGGRWGAPLHLHLSALPGGGLVSRAVWGGPAPCGPRVRAVLLLLPDPSTPSFLPPSLYPFLPIFLPPSLAPSPLHLPPPSLPLLPPPFPLLSFSLECLPEGPDGLQSPLSRSWSFALTGPSRILKTWLDTEGPPRRPTQRAMGGQR